MNIKLVAAIVFVAFAIGFAGCKPRETPAEYEALLRSKLEQKRVSNGYFGNIDLDVKTKVDAYRMANAEQRRKMWKEAR